jgi:hypothetical protein
MPAIHCVVVGGGSSMPGRYFFRARHVEKAIVLNPVQEAIIVFGRTGKKTFACRRGPAGGSHGHAQCQKNASSRMIGSGIPISQSSAPFPNDMFSLRCDEGVTPEHS